jgi:hypothetical protein
MRFISKSTNLLVVLRPGLSAQPLTGTPAKPTVSVRFKEGVADVPDGELTEMMLAHPGFNNDFISVDEGTRDPYASNRAPSESHIMTELKYGTPVNRTISGKAQLPPEIQKIVQEAAIGLAKEMLPGMVKEVLAGLVKSHEENKQTVVSKPKGRPGRKPSIKKELAPEVVETPTSPL